MAYDPNAAAQKARLVQFVYNMYGSGSELTPPVDPGLAEQGYDFLLYLTAHDWETVKFYGYLAASKTNPGDLVLAIRGTEDAAEWLLDFAALPLPYLDKGFVAAGFRSIAETFQLLDTAGNSTALVDAITAQNTRTPITGITILGHSLGSALATLAAAELAFKNPAGIADKISLWTYASPRVGLSDFMDSFNKAVPATFRVWNVLDIVPEVPTFPYVHVGQSEELKQSQAQLDQLKVTPSCEHHLSTYQWLLDAAVYSLDQACDNNAPVAVAAVAMEVAVIREDERKLGVAALYHAMN